MKQRSPIAVFFLPIITLGIYSLVWEVKTKNEMNALGANIPTAWLLIVPIANWYWLWKYSEGVEKVTHGKMSGVLAFVLLFLLGIIGHAIVQNEFNSVSDTPVAATPSFSPASSTEPTTFAQTAADAPTTFAPAAPAAPTTFTPASPADNVTPTFQPQPPVVPPSETQPPVQPPTQPPVPPVA